MRRRIGAGALAAGMILVACTSSGNPTGVNGCDGADFVDRTGAGASRLINFGGQGGSGSFAFEPSCMTVSAGQSVTFQGDFLSHPLRPGIAAGQSGTSSPDNPIPVLGASGSTTVTFPTAGTYPFFCNIHHGDGMFGVVKVQ